MDFHRFGRRQKRAAVCCPSCSLDCPGIDRGLSESRIPGEAVPSSSPWKHGIIISMAKNPDYNAMDNGY